MGFDQPYNWQGNFVPDNSSAIPCGTKFGSPTTTIISTLTDKRYYVGKRLIMPRNGALRLASSNSAISFVASSNTQCTPTNTLNWVGGTVPAQRNDFYCHRNWLQDGAATLSPPCSASVVQFDPSDTYKVSVDPSVRLIIMASISAVGAHVSDTSGDLSVFLPQIDLVRSNAYVYVGALPTPICTNRTYLQFTTSGSTRTCACFSSCPTPEMELQYQDLLRTTNAAASNADRTAFLANITRSYTGTYTPAALGVSAAVITNNLANSTQASFLASALRTAILGLPAYTVTVPQLSNVSAGLRVTGSVTTFTGALAAPGATTVPTSLSWTASTFPTNGVTPLQNLISATLTPLLLAYQASYLAAQSQAAQDSLPSTATNVVTEILANPAASTAVNLSNSDSCFSACTTNCQSCASSVTPLLVAAGLNQTQADALFNAIANAKNSDSNWTATSQQINDVITTSQQAQQANTQAQASQPITRTLRSTLPLARSRTVIDQLRALMPENRAALAASMLAALATAPGISNVSNLQIGWTPEWGSQSQSARRRRATTTTPSAVTAGFDYTVTCAPTDTACLTAATASSTLGTTLVNLLNNAFNTLSITAPQCQVLTGSTPGWNSGCLSTVASNYCAAQLNTGATETVARSATQQLLFNMTRCGLEPTYPNGTCYDSSEESAATTASLNLATSVPCALVPTTATPVTTIPSNTTAVAGSSSSGSGGLSLPIVAAAAGGGVLLLALIAFFVVRRRRSSASAKKGEPDRTVVAFENPMYDDPTQAQPVYDQSQAALHDSEGLYDEPAFNQTAAKQNPIYQSQEDLAGAGGDGYLDVAPNTHKVEDVGYLGANPGAEDVGYLGGEPVYDNKDANPGAAEPVYDSGDFAAPE